MPSEQPVLEYGRTSPPARWRTGLAALLTVPVGWIAGWITYDAGMMGMLPLACFAVVCPLCIALLATRRRILLGLAFCVVMSATVVLRGAPDGTLIQHAVQHADQFALLLGPSASLSLLTTIPLTAAKRPTASPGDAVDRAGG